MDYSEGPTETPLTATSPILGSSTFKRKFLKAANSKRKSAKIKLSEKFANELITSEKPLTKGYTSEAINVSFETCGSSDKFSNSKSELSSSNSNLIGFQTASGKQLTSKVESSNFANELMSDFFNPNIITNKEKKYNFLSKYPLNKESQSEPNKYEKVKTFVGFDEEDIRLSRKINENIQNIIGSITTDNFNDCRKNIAHHFSLVSHDYQERNTRTYFRDVKVTREKSEDLMKSDSVENSLYQFTEDMFSITEQMGPKIDRSVISEEKLIMNLSASETKDLQCQKQSEIINSEAQYTSDKDLNKSISCDNRKEIEKTILDNSNEQGLNEECPQFTTGSGQKISISSSSMNKVKGILGELHDIKPLSEPNTSGTVMNKLISQKKRSEQHTSSKEITTPKFTTASGKKLEISSDKLLKIQNIFKDIQDLPISDYLDPTGNSDYKESEKQKENLKNNFNLDQCNRILKPCEIKESNSDENSKKCNSLFSTASGKGINLPSSSLLGAHKIFDDIPGFEPIGICDLKKNKQSCFNEEIEKNSSNTIETKTNHTPMRKISKIIVGEQNNETNYPKTPGTENESNFITPQKTVSSRRRLGGSASKSKSISDAALSRAKMLFGDLNFDDLKLPSHLKIESPVMPEASKFTPKQLNKVNTPQVLFTPVAMKKKNESFLTDIPPESSHPFVIQKPTTKNLTELEEDLDEQQSVLEKKIEFIIKKKNAIKSQILAQTSNKRSKLDPPEKKNKINLKDVKNLEIQSDYVEKTDVIILQINPQNASLIHFNNNWIEVPTVTTEDGCILVPNSQGFIGLSEIEAAFSSMFGIEKKLMPDGWMKNHYRWIIWKLASYERVFPATLGGCLNINNVIKQLKYRYNREIYNAERPALRKIYEMDDSPQKRMTLCISNIIKNGDKTELELTDGWYSIQTIIDDPLIQQINNQRIKIGSKLIISGAELINCEGCHPLEFEQSRKVRLKIHFNSTRRAAWFTKLGYQKDTSPLPIKLNSAIWNGGLIGKITVYIMRTYPVIFREKTEFSVFWRNQNAENKKIQEFENECMNKYEQGDNMNIKRRNVCCLLQMAVIDISEDTPKPFRCTIWDASEAHLEQLRENQVVSFYNVTLRCNGELSCNKKSYLQLSEHKTVKYEKYRRKYVELSSFSTMSENTLFGEFDTVGFLLKKSIQENNQRFWLTDLKDNFLLVVINEGPSSCLLLNKVEESNLVAVCNLKLKENHDTYVVAAGSFQTIITQYPQHDFLREKMEELGQINKNEVVSILDQKQHFIDKFENGSKHEPSSESGNTLNFSRATSTDAVMSMINLEDIVDYHVK